MRNRILLLVLLTICAHQMISAQKKGTITYKQTVFVHKNLSPEQQAYKALLPETVNKKFKLYFNEHKASLQAVKEKQMQGMQIQMGGGSEEAWFDLQNKTSRKYFELDEEIFYTEDKMLCLELETTGKTKTILGYKCKEYLNEDLHLWLSTELPDYLTPMIPLHLPGCILAIESDKIAYQAIDISKELDESKLSPKIGSKINEEQAADLREEMMNEIKSKIK